MNWGTAIGEVASAVVILGFVGGIVRWMIIHEIRAIRSELRPNGGTSFRDHQDLRFDAIQDHLRARDKRMDGIDHRLDGLDSRMNHG